MLNNKLASIMGQQLIESFKHLEAVQWSATNNASSARWHYEHCPQLNPQKVLQVMVILIGDMIFQRAKFASMFSFVLPKLNRTCYYIADVKINICFCVFFFFCRSNKSRSQIKVCCWQNNFRMDYFCCEGTKKYNF